MLLALVEKGLSREAAYKVVHKLSMESWHNASDFRDLLRSDPEIGDRLSGQELDGLFDHRYYVRYVDEIFQRAGLT